ncbi:MAG TPA: HAMP domain-containing sensor histidine kinase [Chitinophagaceae bacterium]|nr:HAMP domain-containing sensor histidine kinase [Chitinophagaceae bacterium]
MKRTFSIITILISLSLIGIIVIQVSWIKNMVMLREEQIKHSVEESAKTVAAQLAEHKGSYAAGNTKRGLLTDEFILDFSKPLNIGQRVDMEEVRKKFVKAFLANELKDIRFEFGIASFDNNDNTVFEKVTANFMTFFEDTIHNHIKYVGLEALSGTAGENLSTSEVLVVIIPNIKSFVYRSLKWRIATSIAFTIIILAAFYLTVRTMLRQKKLAKIKNDFINNMTHEFKTPIATISLAVDAMRNEKVLEDREKMNYFNSIIKEENQRMNRQVETILKASQLEKQEVDLNLKPVHIHEVIKDVVDNFALQLEDRKGKVEMILDAQNDTIEADEVHLSNLVNNLVDNALKYSKENTPPVVKLSTHSNGKKFSLKIEDNGIGMTRDTLKKIFERFYRAHTGNIHNVKGFGLGLSYVKTMVEAHDGDIKAESILGKGSTFTVDLPLKKV